MGNRAELGPYSGRASDCPLCGCKEHEGHIMCFHCMNCTYLQCCDYDGFYDRHPVAKPSEQSTQEPA